MQSCLVALENSEKIPLKQKKYALQEQLPSRNYFIRKTTSPTLLVAYFGPDDPFPLPNGKFLLP